MHTKGPQDIERITAIEGPPPCRPWLPRAPARVSLFSHHAYLDHDIYSDAIADVVGYWAEDRISGGVAVFDRLAEERSTPHDPPNAFFNACRYGVTMRYFQLRDEQQQAMVDLFLAQPNPATYPLPILGDEDKRVRVVSHLAILRLLSRDVWERKPPTKDEIKLCERRPTDQIDYPENRDIILGINKRLGILPPLCVPSRGLDQATPGQGLNKPARAKTRVRAEHHRVLRRNDGGIRQTEGNIGGLSL